MEEREPKMLRAFTAMEVDASGRLKTEQIQRAHVARRREQLLGDVMMYRWELVPFAWWSQHRTEVGHR